MKLLKRVICSLVVAAILSAPVFFATEARAATVVMQTGSTGEQVSQLQRNLRNLGYYNYSNITGYYGSVTKYAVMKFQQANNLYVDGIAGSATQSRIGDALRTVYTVQPGDSLWIISQKYGTTVDRLKALNNLTVDGVYTGQVLKISGTASTTVVSQTQSEDLYWLSRIIEAEATGESYLGKVAVGNVVMNRKASSNFPNTIKGVVFDSYKGIAQFSPVADGRIYNTPSQDSVRAAQEALAGGRPVGSATYFFNPAKSAAIWIVNNKIYVTRIGNHVFYR